MTFVIHLHDKLSRRAGYLAIDSNSMVSVKDDARTFASLDEAKSVLSTLATSRDYVASVHVGSFN